MRNLIILVGLVAFVVVFLEGCGGNVKSSPKRTGLAPNIDLGSSRVNTKSTAIGDISGVSSQEIKKQTDLRSVKVIYFDYDSSSVREEFTPVLEAHATFLAENFSGQVVLEGHTDERGTREYNLALGERRAFAVRRQLLILGASESQVEVVSFGEERPEMFDQNEEVYSLNRRVEIVY